MEKPRTRWRCFLIFEVLAGLFHTALWTASAFWWTRAVAAIKYDANYAKYYVHICQDPNAICDKIDTCNWTQLQLTLVSVKTVFYLNFKAMCKKNSRSKKFCSQLFDTFRSVPV